MNDDLFSIMAKSPDDLPETPAERHIARRYEDTALKAFVPQTLRLLVIAQPINVMFTRLTRRVGGVDVMWPVPTCPDCLREYAAMGKQKAAAE